MLYKCNNTKFKQSEKLLGISVGEDNIKKGRLGSNSISRCEQPNEYFDLTNLILETMLIFVHSCFCKTNIYSWQLRTIAGAAKIRWKISSEVTRENYIFSTED